MMDGWFKLHRKIKDSSIFSDPEILRLWLLCLIKASYKSRSIIMNRDEIKLDPGQFVTGRKSLCKEYNDLVVPTKKVKETTLWSWVKKLEKWRMIDIKSTNKYSIISIVKWGEYQEVLTTERQLIDNGLATELQQNDTNKKEKKEKKGEEWGEDDIPYL